MSALVYEKTGPKQGTTIRSMGRRLSRISTAPSRTRLGNSSATFLAVQEYCVSCFFIMLRDFVLCLIRRELFPGTLKRSRSRNFKPKGWSPHMSDGTVTASKAVESCINTGRETNFLDDRIGGSWIEVSVFRLHASLPERTVRLVQTSARASLHDAIRTRSATILSTRRGHNHHNYNNPTAG